MAKDCLCVAVIGTGYWGKNLVRNFATTQRCNLKYVCDCNKTILAKHKAQFPFIQVSANFDVDNMLN
jgi:UDP-2-acetamido-3-amino-2,3-dideoxy-glucuronate N-acetyltransferase